MDEMTRDHRTQRMTATPLSLPLPFPDDADRPIDLVLTGAAHRELDPDRRPPLRLVVPVASEQEPDPSDTRPAQARALLRSGMPVSTIAAALGVDVALVGHWTADVEVRRRRRGPDRSGAAAVRLRAASGSSADDAPLGDGVARGLALALIQVTDGTVSIVHDRLDPVGLLVAEVRRRTGLPAERLRVSLRVAPPLATDRVRGEVAHALGVDVAKVVAGRSAVRTTASGYELRVDISDERVAALVGDWMALPGGASHQGEDGASGCADPADRSAS